MSVSPAAWGLLAIELCVVLITAFGIVSVTYQTRGQFALLEQSRQAQQVQWEEWGRLLLEESAFSSPSRVERVAREQLEMILPSVENIRAMEYK
ncbi:MAG: cell division protein FtsL [Reinekea sp.]|jgi:cell division protein FtsL